MRFETLIKGGRVVTASETRRADVGIAGGKIAAVGDHLTSDIPCQLIDATGMYVMPGGIDAHVHFQLPVGEMVTAEDFASGTRAAACGGVTTIIDFANQDRAKGLVAGIEARRKEADGRVCVDYSLHCVITKWNKATRAEMERVIALGIPTFKMFMTYEERGLQSDDAALFDALSASAENRSRILVHAESDRVMSLLIAKYHREKEKYGAYAHALSRPNFIEEEAVQRAIKWAEATQGRLYMVHMSTGEAADLIRDARRKGVNVYAETCPQYLLLNDEVFKDRDRGHLYATCPQVKKKKDNERLWKALAEGDVSVVATDTCTFTTEQKAAWGGDFTKIPYGLPGVETLLPAVYTGGVLEGRFSVNHFVSLVCTHPAKLMGLYPQKGALEVGSDADVVVIHPEKRRKVDWQQLETHCDWSPYEGMELAGFPVWTLSRGRVVVAEGAFVGDEGHGRFVERQAGGDI